MDLSGYMKKSNRKPRLEKGQVFVLIALGMVALIAVIGLATDAMMIYKTKQDLQRSVDSASLACAYKLPDQPIAAQAANEFMRLHGYVLSGTSPDTTLTISYPNSDTKKICHIDGTTNASYYFLRILGFNSMVVSATGESEAAPMDVYLILDLSESMVYDTERPSQWPDRGSDWRNSPDYCTSWDNSSYYDCIAKWCNFRDTCAPLDTSSPSGIGIKTAAKIFVDQLDPRYDRVGLVTYDQAGVKVIGLTDDFDGPNGVKAKIDSLNAFDHQGGPDSLCPNTSPSGCNKNTNIGDGIMVAHDNIASEGRIDAIWSMVLLTDGKANIYRSCSGCPPSCGGSSCNTLHLCEQCSQAEDWAMANALDTWTRHEVVIYTIGYGDEFTQHPEYKQVLIRIADQTDNGQLDGSTNSCPVNNYQGNCFATPDGPKLQAAFVEIAKRIYSRLLQ